MTFSLDSEEVLILDLRLDFALLSSGALAKPITSSLTTFEYLLTTLEVVLWA
jgi:hypothetical protein